MKTTTNNPQPATFTLSASTPPDQPWGARVFPLAGSKRTATFHFESVDFHDLALKTVTNTGDLLNQTAEAALAKDAAVQKFFRAKAQAESAHDAKRQQQAKVDELKAEAARIKETVPDDAAARLRAIDAEIAGLRDKAESDVNALTPVVDAARSEAEVSVRGMAKRVRGELGEQLAAQRVAIIATIEKAIQPHLGEFLRVETAIAALSETHVDCIREFASDIRAPIGADVLPLQRAAG